MAMETEWEIKGRSDRCAVTGRPFAEGEVFYTLLFREGGGFRRQDLSEEAWAARNDNIRPFSFWRSVFEPAPATPPREPIAKGDAETLLRHLIAEGGEARTNARFVLAAMLERRRLLRAVEAKTDAGGRVLIYEHAKTGEVFVIRDPGLRLDQLAEVQAEVAELLG